MSLVARNGVFLARALGDKSICELLSPQGRFCSTCLSEPVQPRKALGEPVATCLLGESRSKPHPEAECFFSEP
jgi:hypothetical protein